MAEKNQTQTQNSTDDTTSGDTSNSFEVPEGHVLVPQSTLERLESNQKTDAKVVEGFQEVTILSDGYNFVGRSEEDGKTVQVARLALRGEKVRLPDSEVKRGREIGALGTEDDLRKLELAQSEGGYRPDGAALGRMGAPEILAYLANNSTDIERVRELEESRENPRAHVLKAIDIVEEFNAANDGE